ncbi:MAG: DUF3172 domain-containing protein [Scytolyngbya sp. HA4215-MV1]|jgi:hypothetical protein|nr:DUF3172 domain-containing protein [Scytolyngbya sp. HA4215-MV1]
MARKSRPSAYDYDRDDYGTQESPRRKSSKSTSLFNATSLAVLGGVFILGIGVGIGFSSAANTGQGSNVFSRESIDLNAPNPELCVQFGASAIAMDTRLFVTLNPFNVYVTQPTMRPGCILRSNNWSILEQRKLVTTDQVRECKNRLNTFGFTGKLEEQPQIDCVYQNDAAKNLFITQPGSGAPPSENQKF